MNIAPTVSAERDELKIQIETVPNTQAAHITTEIITLYFSFQYLGHSCNILFELLSSGINIFHAYCTENPQIIRGIEGMNFQISLLVLRWLPIPTKTTGRSSKGRP